MNASIVCATDFSAAAVAGVTAAAALAEMLGAEDLWLVHALDLTSLQVAGLAFEQAREQSELALAKSVAELQKLTTRPVRPALLYGPAADAVCEFAEHRGASLLVVASTGHGGSLLLRLGSTSERIAEQTRTPVLIVRDSTPFVQWRVSRKPLRVLLGANHTSNWDSCLALLTQLRSAAPCDVSVGLVYYANEERDRYGLPALHSMDAPDRQVEALLARDLEARIGKLEGSGDTKYVPSRGVGRIGDHVVQLANAERAELIAVGTHRRTGLSRLSSVANVVLHYADQSVLVVPPQETPKLGHIRTPQVILAASDLSDVSNLALTQAFALVDGRSGARVIVFHARTPELIDPQTSSTTLRQRLGELIPARLKAVTTIEVEPSVSPAESIAQAAERHGADLICVGSRGHSVLSRALLGSVVRALLEHAQRPVLVVKPPPQ